MTGASEAATTKMTLTSAGRLGVGLTDPSDLFEVSNSADTPTRAIVTAEDSSGTNQNAFIKTKAKGNYFEGLEMASTSGHIGMWGGYYSGSAVLQARVGGSGINSSDVLAMQIDANGHVTKPANSAFYCTGGAQNNIAKDGNREFLEGDGSEVYDVNNDLTLSDNVSFSPGDVRYFTAPVTGKYMFTFRTRLDNIELASSYIYVFIRTANRNYTIAMFDPDGFDSSPAYFAQQGTVIADMDVNDTAYPMIYIAGGSSTTDSSSYEFSGILIG